jgi:hypothetical protein
MSLDWSSQTGAGSLYGCFGAGGGGVGVGGMIGPPLVPKSTFIQLTSDSDDNISSRHVGLSYNWQMESFKLNLGGSEIRNVSRLFWISNLIQTIFIGIYC